MEIAKIMEGKPKNNIYGLMGNINITTNNANYSIVTDHKFNGTVKEYLNSEKGSSSLKMVMLNESFLTKKSNELSVSELKKVSLAKALIENKDYLVLNYFEKELNYQEKENFKRLWRKLSKDYEKTIIIFTNDITSIWSLACELIIVDKYNIINTVSKENYFKIIDNINKPEIVKFTELMRELGIDVEDYMDTKELLKAIYRIKESK